MDKTFVNAVPIHILISRVRGPFGKYGPSFFPSFYGLSVKRAVLENKEGKNRYA